jgi:hypothetical protein
MTEISLVLIKVYQLIFLQGMDNIVSTWQSFSYFSSLCKPWMGMMQQMYNMIVV